MHTIRQTATPTTSHYRLISTALLTVFCLVRMERYISVATHPALAQRAATEQVENATPDYRIPVLSARGTVPYSATPIHFLDDAVPNTPFFAVNRNQPVFIAVLHIYTTTSPLPDPFGYLYHHRLCPSADNNDDHSITC
jgi:hypothetical protein